MKKGGIIIPDTAKKKPAGQGHRRRHRQARRRRKIPFNVKKGDKILMPKYGGTEIKLDGKEYQIMREENILGILADNRKGAEEHTSAKQVHMTPKPASTC